MCDHSEKSRLFMEGVIDYSPQDGKPYIAASRCGECGKVFFPKRPFCTACASEAMEAVALSDRAVLHTCTTVHIGVKGFATPYILGWLVFPEGVRLVAQIHSNGEPLCPGQAMVMEVGVIRTLEDGTEITGYVFRPAPEEVAQ